MNNKSSKPSWKQTLDLLVRILIFCVATGMLVGLILMGVLFLYGDDAGSCNNRCEATSLSVGPLTIAMGAELIFIVFKSLILKKKIKARDWILFVVVAILVFVYGFIHFSSS